MPRDKRPYITVHEGMPEHPKVEPLSDAAFRLLVETWCWSKRQRTDGLISEAVWQRRGTKKARTELVAAGLIEEVPGGVAVHDYAEHQTTSEHIERVSEVRREAGRRGGNAKAEATRKASKPVANARKVATPPLQQTGSKPLPEVEVEKEIKQTTPPGGTLVPAPANGEPSAKTLIGEWIDHLGARPPGAVVGQVAKHVGQMLTEGIPYSDVRTGLQVWQEKRLHPSTLPSIVHEVRTPAAPIKSRRQAETDDWFTRNMARIQAEEGDQLREVTS